MLKYLWKVSYNEFTNIGQSEWNETERMDYFITNTKNLVEIEIKNKRQGYQYIEIKEAIYMGECHVI